MLNIGMPRGMYRHKIPRLFEDRHERGELGEPSLPGKPRTGQHDPRPAGLDEFKDSLAYHLFTSLARVEFCTNPA